jgi:predicted RNA-binding Zn ribbon-like protein
MKLTHYKKAKIMKQHADNYVALGFGKEYAWLDLANSLEWNGYGKLTDHLRDPAWWASHFVKHWNLASPLPRPVPLAQLVALRTLLRRMAEKLIAGEALEERDLNALNSYLNVPVRVKLFQHQNRVQAELVPLRSDWAWILSRIAASFAEMLALNRPDRLKYCPNEGCKWIFYDRTKANTRRWCNDRTCGNRDRVRRARQRGRKARAQIKSSKSS